jgi:hypothetical protein
MMDSVIGARAFRVETQNLQIGWLSRTTIFKFTAEFQNTRGANDFANRSAGHATTTPEERAGPAER